MPESLSNHRQRPYSEFSSLDAGVRFTIIPLMIRSFSRIPFSHFPRSGLALRIPIFCLCVAGFIVAVLPARGLAEAPASSSTEATEKPTPPGVAPAEVNRWKLIWRDEFDGTALDETKWSYRGLGRRESAIIARDCVTLDGHGLLHLWVKEKDGGLQNAMIGTQHKFETKFGIMAARIRFPRQQGQHGSFWMQPAAGVKTPNDAGRSGAEVDVIEWFGADRRDSGAASNVYWPGVEKLNRAGHMMDLHDVLPKDQLLSDDFHIYSVEWSPKGYLFRVDDREVMRITEGISLQPEYLILSLLTADWETAQLDHAQLPNSMDVDWVRVWQTETPESDSAK